jgi:glycine/D-amino acid oxidase-like deaminating enzyme
MDALKIEHKWGGIMPFSRDGKPIIGALVNEEGERIGGLWCISGLGGAGFMRGGMAGLLLAEMMEGNPAAANLLLTADPARFRVAEEQGSLLAK